MRNKHKLYSILVIGLALLLVGLGMITEGCGHRREIEEPKLGPLEAPFSEIIPDCEDLYCQLYGFKTKAYEDTIYRPDGVIIHSRTFESSDVDPDALLAMTIYDYPDEEAAKKYIHERKEVKWYDETDTEYYAMRFNFPPEDIAGYTIFWKEPIDEEYQGEEVIMFRVGHYVGHYEVWLNAPPKLEDGYFLPPELHDLLEMAVKKTIPKLRSI